MTIRMSKFLVARLCRTARETSVRLDSGNPVESSPFEKNLVRIHSTYDTIPVNECPRFSKLRHTEIRSARGSFTTGRIPPSSPRSSPPFSLHSFDLWCGMLDIEKRKRPPTGGLYDVDHPVPHRLAGALFGALSDHTGQENSWIAFFAGLGVLETGAIAGSPGDHVVIAGLLFILGSVGGSGGNEGHLWKTRADGS